MAEEPSRTDDTRTASYARDLNVAPPPAGDDASTVAATQVHVPTDGKATHRPEAPLPLPGLKGVRKLGEGAFGCVWLYVEERTGMQVAVKFFAHGTGQEWLLVQAEVKQLALLHADPGIVQLRGVDLEAAPPYYIMTYAPGGSLATRLQAGQLYRPTEVLKIFREAAEALAYVHAKGVRHCDLKPGNILLDARGRALVADFGQAHLASEASPALGTFFYMAPEQADLKPAIPDTRWDVYGLGAVVYALLTGRPPHENDPIREELAVGGKMAQRLQRYREWVRQAPRAKEHRELPDMDQELAAIIDRCLEVDPEKRYRDAGAVLDALNLRERRRRQRPMLLFGLAAPVLLLLAMAVGGWFLGQLAVSDAETAQKSQATKRDKLLAQIMARLVDARLQKRTDLVTQRAGDADLAWAVRNHFSRENLCGRLAEFQKTDQTTDKKPYFFKYTLTDVEGHIIADDPTESSLWDRGQTWSWRDWFSAGGHKFGEETKIFPPHKGVYVSQPYVAAGVDEKGQANPVVLTISAPIAAPDDPSKPVGMLAGSLHVADLYDWLLTTGFADGDGFPVLVNDRRHCLAHGDLATMNRLIRPSETANPEPLKSDLLQDLIAGRKEAGVDDHYVDPLDGRTYLAGYAPAEKSHWVVVVEQDPTTALQPVQRLKERLVWFGLAALAAAGAMTSGLWGWLIWTLRRQEEGA